MLKLILKALNFKVLYPFANFKKNRVFVYVSNTHLFKEIIRKFDGDLANSFGDRSV